MYFQALLTLVKDFVSQFRQYFFKIF